MNNASETVDVGAIGAEPGLNTTPLSGQGTHEASLDIEMAVSMAPGAKVRAFEGHKLNDVLSAIATYKDPVSGDLARQISNSWSIALDQTSAQTLHEYVMQGQSFFVASGDDGAFTQQPVAAMGGFGEIPIQASDLVTDVGGTTLTIGCSTESYESEMGWVGVPDQGNPGYTYASAGGYFGPGPLLPMGEPLPPYQAGIVGSNGASPQYRNVPDVAMAAANIEDCYFDPQVGPAGTHLCKLAWGTSAAAPLWAGFVALVNQASADRQLPPVGFLNRTLYAIGQNANRLFHDVVAGPPTAEPGLAGFVPGPGYDLVTGWGSPQCTMIDELACATTCGGPLCVDILADPNNCGSCGSVCPSGACIEGKCPAVSVGITPGCNTPQNSPPYCIVGKGFPVGDTIEVDFTGVVETSQPPCTTSVDGDGKFSCSGFLTCSIFCNGCQFGDPSVVITDTTRNAMLPPVTVSDSFWCYQNPPCSPPPLPHGGLDCPLQESTF